MQNRKTKTKKRLSIRLIGAFSVMDAIGQIHPIPGKKDRAVLAFLAAHRGRAIARERLVELVWPEAADGAGRASLRQSLSAIRKKLPDVQLFSVTRDTVSILDEAAETDVDRLKESVTTGILAESVSLASGEMFLDDLSGVSADYDTWRATEQSRIETLVSDLLEGLARRAETSNDIKKAVAALSQLVAISPLNEDAQRRYMRALIRLGQSNSAMRQYRRLEGFLDQELGVRPDMATRTVFEEAKAKIGATTGRGSESANPPEIEARSNTDGQPTIVVHPFRDLSQDSEDRFFAEALTDSVSSALSHISNLMVVAAPPTSDAHSQALVLTPLPREGDETFGLQGSVRIVGSRVRVGARLLGRESGRIYWADDYDRRLSDIFAVQDDITHRIVVEMRIKLSEGEKVRVLEKYTENVDVWTRLMRADVLINSLVEENGIEGRLLLEEAIRIDPNCVAVWGEMGDAYLAGYMMGWRELPRAEYLDRALNAAQTAQRLDPGFTHALNVVSLVQAFQGDFASATETSRQALSQAPRNPEVTANCAYALVICGHVEEAYDIICQAIDDTPIPPMWYVTVEGMCLLALGKPEAAG